MGYNAMEAEDVNPQMEDDTADEGTAMCLPR